MIKRLMYNIYVEADKRGMFPAVLRKWAGKHVDLIGQRGRKWIEKDPIGSTPRSSIARNCGCMCIRATEAWLSTG